MMQSLKSQTLNTEESASHHLVELESGIPRAAGRVDLEGGDGVVAEVELLQLRGRGGDEEQLLPREARAGEAEHRQPAEARRKLCVGDRLNGAIIDEALVLRREVPRVGACGGAPLVSRSARRTCKGR